MYFAKYLFLGAELGNLCKEAAIVALRDSLLNPNNLYKKEI